MPRYILIDDASGYIWGDVRADWPADAAEGLDNDLGVYGRTYEVHGPRHQPDGQSAYHVHRVDDDELVPMPKILDGRDTLMIDYVMLRFPKVSVVTMRDIGE